MTGSIFVSCFVSFSGTTQGWPWPFTYYSNSRLSSTNTEYEYAIIFTDSNFIWKSGVRMKNNNKNKEKTEKSVFKAEFYIILILLNILAILNYYFLVL